MNNALGLDVNHYHAVQDWSAVINAGYSFIGIKVSEGTYNTDPTYLQHRDGARANPFALVVYYHIARQGDPIAEANRFVKLVGELNANERLSLDTERSSAVSIRWVDSFYAQLPTDRRNLLYTSNAVWVGMGNPTWARATNVDLWLPRYGSSTEPVIPLPWRDYKIWQNSESGIVPGVDGPCDTNIWNGTVDDLHNYASVVAT